MWDWDHLHVDTTRQFTLSVLVYEKNKPSMDPERSHIHIYRLQRSNRKSVHLRGRISPSKVSLYVDFINVTRLETDSTHRNELSARSSLADLKKRSRAEILTTMQYRTFLRYTWKKKLHTSTMQYIITRRAWLLARLQFYNLHNMLNEYVGLID